MVIDDDLGGRTGGNEAVQRWRNNPWNRADPLSSPNPAPNSAARYNRALPAVVSMLVPLQKQFRTTLLVSWNVCLPNPRSIPAGTPNRGLQMRFGPNPAADSWKLWNSDSVYGVNVGGTFPPRQDLRGFVAPWLLPGFPRAPPPRPCAGFAAFFRVSAQEYWQWIRSPTHISPPSTFPSFVVRLGNSRPTLSLAATRYSLLPRVRPVPI